MKQNEIKKKLKALSTPGVKALICDILIDYDKQGDNYAEEAGILGYSNYVERACQRMKGIYEKQLQRHDVTVQTRDLESLIASLKDGTEPPFVNKLNSKNGHTTG